MKVLVKSIEFVGFIRKRLRRHRFLVKIKTVNNND